MSSDRFLHPQRKKERKKERMKDFSKVTWWNDSSSVLYAKSRLDKQTSDKQMVKFIHSTQFIKYPIGLKIKHNADLLIIRCKLSGMGLVYPIFGFPKIADKGALVV